jgi:pimeloyl-ACP methyl ester carboxylesterase
MSAITIDGELVHYEVLGRGRPVMLVHGWLGSWRYWVPAMQQWQAKFRVYALDLFGFGDSGKNPNKYSLEHQIDMLADFTEQLGLTKTAVVGHGLGAMITAEFARRYPARVPRLMLISAPLFDTRDLEQRAPVARKIMQTVNNRPPLPDHFGPDAPTIISPGAAMRAALAAYSQSRPIDDPFGASPSLRRFEAPVYNPLLTLFSENMPEALLGRCFRRGEATYEKLRVDVLKTDARVLVATAETFDAGPMLDTLWLLQMPTMVLHGANDRLMPPPNAEVMRHVTQEKDTLLMPPPLENIGHFPMLEDDRFLRLVSDFLEANDINRAELGEIKERWRRRTR